MLPGATNPKPPLIQQLLVLLLLNSRFWFFFFCVCLIMWPPVTWEGRLSPYLFHPCQLVAKSSRLRKAGLPSGWKGRSQGQQQKELDPFCSQITGPRQASRGAAVQERRTAAVFILLLLHKETWSFYLYCCGENKKKIDATLNIWASCIIINLILREGALSLLVSLIASGNELRPDGWCLWGGKYICFYFLNEACHFHVDFSTNGKVPYLQNFLHLFCVCVPVTPLNWISKNNLKWKPNHPYFYSLPGVGVGE